MRKFKWITRVLEENKDQFRKQIVEIRTTINKLQYILELDQSYDNHHGLKDKDKHPDGWKEQAGQRDDEENDA